MDGYDRNFGRLVMVCATHYRRFGEWPHYARMKPSILVGLVGLLGHEQFVQLSKRLTMSPSKRWTLAVGSRKGLTDYDHMEAYGDRETSERWLAVRPLPESPD